MLLYEISNNYYVYDCLSSEIRRLSGKKNYDLRHHVYTEEDYQLDRIECSIKNVQNIINDNLTGIVLKITELCNMKCSYCPHAQENNTLMKTHANKKMTEEIAYKGIDCLYARSKKSEKVDIVFFGGEPLIEFELIKKIVFYAENKFKEKQITFNITTNAILLSDEMISFFSQHRFSVCVSLDGPREIHDCNRKDRGGRGTYQKVYGNFMKLKKYFYGTESTVRINAVVDKNCDIAVVEKYFKKIEFQNVSVDLNLVDETGSDEKMISDEVFEWESEYLQFLNLLHLTGRLTEEELPLSGKMSLRKMRKLYNRIKNKSIDLTDAVYRYEYDYCVNGMVVFLNTEGNYYPGISVNEKNDKLIIGNSDDDIQYRKIEEILNISSGYMKSCKNCPVLFDCDLPLYLCLEAGGDRSYLERMYCNEFYKIHRNILGLVILENETESNYIHCDVSEDFDEQNVTEILIETADKIKNRKYSENDILLFPKVGMSSIELVYFMFSIENTFNLLFDSEDLADFGFCTINNITKCILKKMSDKRKG